MVAAFFVDDKTVNEEIVRAGFAWHYKRCSRDENQARLRVRRG
jgi:endonuclease YncB( thermonuclease family)